MTTASKIKVSGINVLSYNCIGLKYSDTEDTTTIDTNLWNYIKDIDTTSVEIIDYESTNSTSIGKNNGGYNVMVGFIDSDIDRRYGEVELQPDLTYDLQFKEFRFSTDISNLDMDTEEKENYGITSEEDMEEYENELIIGSLENLLGEQIDRSTLKGYTITKGKNYYNWGIGDIKVELI